MSVTKSQKKVINYIEENLGVQFSGKNSYEARKFISRYIDMSKYVYDNFRKVGLKDENGNELYEDNIIEYNGIKYLIKYEIGAYMLINISEIDLCEQFEDVWNDYVYPIAQLYWNTDSEEGYVNGLIKVEKENSKTE